MCRNFFTDSGNVGTEFLSFFYNSHDRIGPIFLEYADNRIISRSPRGGDYDESGFSKASNSISMDKKPVPVLVSLGLVTP